MGRFIVEKEIFKLFPQLKVGVIIVHGSFLEPVKDPFELLKELSEKKREEIKGKPQDVPRIKVWRDAFRKVGITPSKYLASVEALIRRVLKGQVPGPIHPLVDLYNAFSIDELVPIGGHDLDMIEGDIIVGFSEGGEEFIEFSGDVEKVPEGEIVYKDEKGILTRRWVWRQTKRDLITEKTKSVFIPIDVLCDVDPHYLVERFSNLVKEYFPDSTIEKGVVTAENNIFLFK